LTPNARPRRENPVGDDRFRKTEILARLYDGDTHVAPELRAKVRDRMAVEADAPPVVARTVGELCARAHAVGLPREQAAAEKLATERKRQVEEAEKARRVRLDTIARRGESVWRDIEAEIERRNATGYDRAASLLLGLRSSVSGQLPKNAARCLTSKSVCGRSGNDMPTRCSSSCGSRRSDSWTRCSVKLAETEGFEPSIGL
jgi:hypothetical protein